MAKINQIEVLDISIKVKGVDKESYISLTDIARFKNPDEPKDIIKNWLRTKSTIEFIGLWEKMHNPNFKGVEFDSFKNEAGANSFVLSPKKWIEKTNAIGIISKSGRYGGTYAHQDIAFEFASWVSSEFKLYLIKEFQRLKREEDDKQKIEWKTSRILARLNYRIHTDAIKNNIIPNLIDQVQKKYAYASEADLLNIALFGISAKEWREQNPKKKGNIRDYATLEQLIVLTNLESFNSELIKQNMSNYERLKILNKIAIEQLKILQINQSNGLIKEK